MKPPVKTQDFPDPRLTGVYNDISGRMTKSLSTVERFKRWGKHYLRAITRAHQLQIRTNFIDPGVQVYGGTLFKDLEDNGGQIFLTLPMKKRANYEEEQRHHHQPAHQPAPVVRPVVQPVSQPVAQPPPVIQTNEPPVDNSTYYYSGGGCFHPDCTVQIYDPIQQNFTAIQISLLQRGDFVKVFNLQGQSTTAKILCLVEIHRTNSLPLVEFKSSGLKITPSHPIRLNDQWELPKNLTSNPIGQIFFSQSQDRVYNVILDKTEVLLEVNGIQCVTFGHGFSGAVVYHSFYGTQRVRDIVEGLEGWEKGYVSVDGSLRVIGSKQ